MAFEFDNLIEQACAEGSLDAVDKTTCKPISGNPGDDPPPPSDDQRCLDPAFAAANPDICAGFPRLILKPEYALTESGLTVQYRTFLRAGGNETELTNGLTYSLADPKVANIEQISGLATGVAPGITTVSVLWQVFHAFAQLEVVQECDDNVSNFVLLIDNSLSSKVGFSGLYASRLAFAKVAARAFALAINYSKDKIALYTFNSSATQLLPFSSDQETITDAIDGIIGTDAGTDIYTGLKAAKDYVQTFTGTKVIVLFTDGEDGGDNDPIALADEFTDAGNFLVVVGLRCWGKYFDELYQMASAGFFLSAYDETASDILDTLPGLKGYMCSGDCAPVPGTYPKAKLDYKDFINWDVFKGHIDLIGLGLWDLQPGHGLYLDMNTGGIKSKVQYTFTAGKTYRISLKVAGNWRWPTQVDKVKVTIGTLVVQTITVSAWDQPFTVYSFDFTPGVTSNEFIQIEDAAGKFDGALVDEISLSNLTDVVTVLIDNFDTEHPVTIDPSYVYYGCLPSPPGAQAADPTPPTPPAEKGT